MNFLLVLTTISIFIGILFMLNFKKKKLGKKFRFEKLIIFEITSIKNITYYYLIITILFLIGIFYSNQYYKDYDFLSKYLTFLVIFLLINFFIQNIIKIRIRNKYAIKLISNLSFGIIISGLFLFLDNICEKNLWEFNFKMTLGLILITYGITWIFLCEENEE